MLSTTVKAVPIFQIQGDGDELTSDGIYVYTKNPPSVQTGDQVEVTGKVIEFTRGGERSANLSLTEVSQPEHIDLLSSANPIPPPVVIGRSGRPPPTQTIDDDDLALFDPHLDGIDYYESIEGMRVLVVDVSAVGTTNRFGEVFVVSNRGRRATGMNSGLGITARERDLNPERIQIDSRLLADPMPPVNTGDYLGDVTGVMSYSYGNFEVLAEAIPSVTPSGLKPEATFLTGDETHLTIASYNVQNLDPGDPPSKFQQLATHIAWNLQSPDIVELQEIQDNSGPTDDDVVAADLTAFMLTSAILEAGGPTYDYYDIPPTNNEAGGEPGGNIRVGYLVNSGRVSMVPESLRALGDTELDIFDRTRKPLEATFVFNDEEFVLINCHLTSKAGSAPLFGSRQPPLARGAEKRKTQAVLLRNHVKSLLDGDPRACVVLLGDFNDTGFSEPLQILTENPPLLANLGSTLPDAERYSHVYQGNASMIDHILMSANCLAPGSTVDIVHVNTGFADRSSDHDPVVARFAGSAGLGQLPAGEIRIVGDSARLQLSQSSPNPAEQSVLIDYLLPNPGSVQLRIFNIAGQLVRTLVDTHQESDRHQLTWNLADQSGKMVSGGVYLYQLRMANKKMGKSMVVIR